MQTQHAMQTHSTHNPRQATTISLFDFGGHQSCPEHAGSQKRTLVHRVQDPRKTSREPLQRNIAPSLTLNDLHTTRDRNSLQSSLNEHTPLLEEKQNEPGMSSLLFKTSSTFIIAVQRRGCQQLIGDKATACATPLQNPATDNKHGLIPRR